MFGVLPAIPGVLFCWLNRHVPVKSGRPCASADAHSNTATPSPITSLIPSLTQSRCMVTSRCCCDSDTLLRRILALVLFVGADDGEAARIHGRRPVLGQE